MDLATCGWENAEAIPPNWEVTLSDFSTGMLKGTRESLKQMKHDFAYQVIDAQTIPFEDAYFDCVIANWVLYHVPDRPQAIAEISRVLKPDGYAYAATFSQQAFAEMKSWVRACNVPAWRDVWNFAHHFSLENGQEQLAPHFAQIKCYNLKNQLVLKQPEPLLVMMQTSTPQAEYNEAQFEHLRELVQRELAHKGSVSINFDIGLFEASKQ